MVDAQVRPLRAFEEDPLSPLDGGVQPGGRVADERGEPLPMSLVFREQSLGIDPLAPAKGVDDALLDRDDRLEFRAERFRGIGPTFEDKVGRFGIRMCDLIEAETLRAKLKTIDAIKQRVIEAFGGHERNDEEGMFS